MERLCLRWTVGGIENGIEERTENRIIVIAFQSDLVPEQCSMLHMLHRDSKIVVSGIVAENPKLLKQKERILPQTVVLMAETPTATINANKTSFNTIHAHSKGHRGPS